MWRKLNASPPPWLEQVDLDCLLFNFPTRMHSVCLCCPGCASDVPPHSMPAIWSWTPTINIIAKFTQRFVWEILLEVPSWRYWDLAHFLEYFIHNFLPTMTQTSVEMNGIVISKGQYFEPLRSYLTEIQLNI